MPTVLTSSQQTFVDITDQRKLSAYITSYNIVTVEGAAASRVFFHLKAEAVRMGE